MKLTGNQVRFPTILPWPTRQRLFFVGRANTVQLLETALVIEGHRQRLFLPLVDTFFQRLLSEWTTVTVPYARIVDFRYSGLWVWRVLLTLLVWLPFLLVSLLFWGLPMDADGVSIALLLGLPALLLTYLLNAHVLVARNYLLFQQANGRLVLTALRIRSKRRREEFQALLERNRQAAGKLPERARAGRPVSGAVLGVLLAYLTCQSLVPPLWALGRTYWAQLSGVEPQDMAFDRFGPGGRPGEEGSLLLLLQPLLQFVYAQGPVVLLAFLLARWNEMLRWSAAGLLALHGVLPVGRLFLAAWMDSGVPQPFNRPSPPVLDTDLLPALAAGVFYLLLTIVLALQRPRGNGEESTATV